jgi:two-component system sensor histidine kinase KdpD
MTSGNRFTDGRGVLAGMIVAALAVALTTLIVYPLKEIAPAVSLGVVYLLAVLLVATVWGAWMGVATAVASALAFNFFHIEPTGRFTIADGEHWVALVVFFVAAMVASELAQRARRQAQQAEERRREADLSAEMARLL